MDIQSYMHGVGREARRAAREMARAQTRAKDAALLGIAAAIERDSARLLEANRQDVEAARAKGLEAAMIDRLTLTAKSVAAMAEGLRQIAQLRDPVGEITDLAYRPTGIQVGRMRVPLGVVAIIYEARPNVTADAAGLCLKAGNAAILRGGSEAIRSNQAIAACVREGLAGAGLPETAVQVIEITDRAAVGELITMKDYVDIIVPRGGKGLIERISSEARIPVLKHLDGVCHVYIDDRADLDKAIRIADNAKTQRYGTCNTMETLLVHRDIAPAGAAAAGEDLSRQGRGAARLRPRARGRGAGAGGADEGSNRAGLVHRVPRADPERARGRRPGSGHRAHRDLRIAAHRRHRHRRLHAGAPVPARSGLQLGDGERLDPLRRRLRVRAGRRDRHLHRQAARARPGRAGGSDFAEVRRPGRRPHPYLAHQRAVGRRYNQNNHIRP